MKDHWDARLRRASELTSMYPFAAGALNFYSKIAAFQRHLFDEYEQASEKSPNSSGAGTLRGELDYFTLLPKFPAFLRVIGQAAPRPLAQAAGRLEEKDSAEWRRLLEGFWSCESRPGASEANADENQLTNDAVAEQCLAWLFLQPYAEHLARRGTPAPAGGTPSNCPLCGANPIVGVLRPEGDGARKSLVCMLCAHEWAFRRLYCPACGEEREPQLAFYSAAELPHVRVDVCDTCHIYLKSVDLSKTGLAVPIVDELATLPLDLWARERGYAKLQVNMLGI